MPKPKEKQEPETPCVCVWEDALYSEKQKQAYAGLP